MIAKKIDTTIKTYPIQERILSTSYTIKFTKQKKIVANNNKTVDELIRFECKLVV